MLAGNISGMPDPSRRIPPPADNVLESWLPVPGFEDGYAISDQGRLWSRRWARCLTQKSNAAGHWQQSLSPGKTPRLVHRIVLEAFVGPCPEGMEALHENDDPGDNRLANLTWGTRSDNQHDRVRNGIHHMARRTACVNGHNYVSGSWAPGPGNSRNCRVCCREKMRRRRAAKRRELAGLPPAS